MIEEGLCDYANPMSILRAVELLLRHIAMPEKAELLDRALTLCGETERKLCVTGNRDGATCREFADYVLETLARLKG